MQDKTRLMQKGLEALFETNVLSLATPEAQEKGLIAIGSADGPLSDEEVREICEGPLGEIAIGIANYFWDKEEERKNQKYN